jgi:parvulin-like peptidyl-prolyl isomerase
MKSRQALWLTLASAASIFAAGALAQTPPPSFPKTPPPATGGMSSAQILPVSLKADHVAATVNGEKILVADVKKVLDSRPYPNTLSEEQKKSLRQAALEVLVEDALMRQYLNKHVPNVSQAAFDAEVKELTADLKKQSKTIEMFLKETNQTQEQLSKDIVARLQWKSLLGRFLPDDKAKPYYDTNKLFFDKVFVRASHILIKLEPKHTKDQRDKAEQQLKVIRQDILTRKITFEDAVKKYSQCPTKDNKDRPPGDIGQFPYKFVVVPEFAKAAFAMKKGELSDVVQSSYGLHLIWVTERTAGEASNFDAIKDTVREVWAQEEELYARVLADQKKNGTIKLDLP